MINKIGANSALSNPKQSTTGLSASKKAGFNATLEAKLSQKNSPKSSVNSIQHLVDHWLSDPASPFSQLKGQVAEEMRQAITNELESSPNGATFL